MPGEITPKTWAEKPEMTAKSREMVSELLATAVRVDFPSNPPIDKDGNPKFTKIDEDLRFEGMNDLGNARRLLKRYGEKMMYVEQIGWYGWTGTHWSFEDGQRLAEKSAHQAAMDMKRELLALISAGPREEQGEEPKDFKERVEKYRKFANASCNANRMTAMLNTAQTYVAKKHDDLDTHKYLVTVDNGTLCLDEGKDANGALIIRLKKHDPKDLISKKIPVKYEQGATCPKFLRALDDIVPDLDIQQFLQRYWGYCLTGAINEQVVVFLHGGGSNGKSLLMGLMSHIFGDYAKSVPIASLMAQDRKSGAAASPDLARLPGARYVTSSEPEAGDRFSENFIKIVSGEESLTVRHLNQGFFEFFPQFKLCVSFNNKPTVRAADDGFWRRVLLVPFEQKFVDVEKLPEYPGAKVKNKNLKAELLEESSGILNWMLDGYRMWRESGLRVPDKVKAATAEYRADSNHVIQFLQAWCDYNPAFEITSARLYEAYELWAKQNAQEPFKKKTFGTKVGEDPKIKRGRGESTNVYKGIQLNAEALAALADKGGRNPWAEGGDDIQP